MTPLIRERKPSGKWLYPQPEQTRRWLVAAGPQGIHTHDMRAAFIANPSERARQVVSQGTPLATASEPRNGANGSRFWLAEHAPSTAHPVTPSDKTSSTPPVVLRDTDPRSTNETAGSGHPAVSPTSHVGLDFDADGFGPAWADTRNPQSTRNAVDDTDDGDDSWITEVAA